MKIRTLSDKRTYSVRLTTLFNVVELCSGVKGPELCRNILPKLKTINERGEICVFDDQYGYLAVRMDNHCFIVNEYAEFEDSLNSSLLAYENSLFKFNSTVELKYA